VTKRGRIFIGILVGLLALNLLIKWLRDPVRLGQGEHRGVDVSAHQGTIDWQQVAASGIDFAYIKATEGGDWVDDHFRDNWKGAGAAGLKRGAYHFFTLRRPGIDQAENFLKTAPPEPGSLPPAIDLEFGGNTEARPDRQTLLREFSVFIQRVESAYQRPALLYLLPEFQASYGIREAFPRQSWLRSLWMRPQSAQSWKIWQYTAFGRVPGITGEVDLNVGRLD
jgi:lysozyme